MIRIILLAICAAGISASEWGYDAEHGPSHWTGVCNADSSLRQSPINVQTPSEPTADFDCFNFNGYENVDATLSNNGHSVVVTVTSGEPLLSGGGLDDTYRLAQFHFHWGSANSQGSEHSIDGQHYPMEVHFVHYNTKYDSVGEAADKADGLAVLGWMFTINKKNKAYKTITKKARKLSPGDTPRELTDLNIRDFMGDDTTYFRYQGSLTTPPCYESVIWTVFAEPISIAKSQIKKMRDVMVSASGELSEEEVPLVDNFRPIQPTNDREVLYIRD